MKKIAQFEKVSFKNYNTLGKEYGTKEIYDDIMLPKRMTMGSAGYDFFAPMDITLKPGETIKVATGIKAWIEEGWVLQIYPRSGFGFQYRLQLDNTVGIIDSDYYNNDSNEGHIFIKLTNDGREGKTLEIPKGVAFAQGIFIPFGITVDDNADGERVGGLGSTTKA